MKKKKFDIDFADIGGMIISVVMIVACAASVVLMILSLCLNQVCITTTNESGEIIKEFYSLSKMLASNKATGEKMFLYVDVIQALTISSVVVTGVGFIIAVICWLTNLYFLEYIAGALLILGAIVCLVASGFSTAFIFYLRGSIIEIGGKLTTVAGGWLFVPSLFCHISNIFLGMIILDAAM